VLSQTWRAFTSFPVIPTVRLRLKLAFAFEVAAIHLRPVVILNIFPGRHPASVELVVTGVEIGDVVIVEGAHILANAGQAMFAPDEDNPQLL
jgi:hypothetical protein